MSECSGECLRRAFEGATGSPGTTLATTADRVIAASFKDQILIEEDGKTKATTTYGCTIISCLIKEKVTESRENGVTTEEILTEGECARPIDTTPDTAISKLK